MSLFIKENDHRYKYQLHHVASLNILLDSSRKTRGGEEEGLYLVAFYFSNS